MRRISAIAAVAVFLSVTVVSLACASDVRYAPFAPYPPRTCVARAGGALPDRGCTPGSLNRAVTQATVATTICVRGYTATIRPPVSVTGPEKRGSMRAYGFGSRTSDFEYDHLVSLELGGAPNDNLNLWPEAHPLSFAKDKIENLLRAEVCNGTVTLAQAQYWIAHDWRVVKPGKLPPVPAGAIRPQAVPMVRR